MIQSRLSFSEDDFSGNQKTFAVPFDLVLTRA